MKNNNDKPRYEKVGIWFGIIVGVFAIFGVRVFDITIIVKPDKVKPSDIINPLEHIKPYVKVSPDTNGIIAQLDYWTKKDRDISNNKYPLSNSLKVSIDDISWIFIDDISKYDFPVITAEIHFPFEGNFDQSIVMSFVPMKEMEENPYHAKVTILSGNEELYKPINLSSNTTTKISYKINLTKIQDLIIRFECHGFYCGIIFEDSYESIN